MRFENHSGASLKTCSSCKTDFSLSQFPKKGEGRTEAYCKPCFNLKRKNKRVPFHRWSVLDLPIRIYLSEIKSRWIDCLFNMLCEYESLLSTEPDLDVDDILDRCSRIDLLIA